MRQRHILILGAGSVGRRHARNFHALGCEISCMDPRPDRLEQAVAEIPLKYKFNDLPAALERAEEFAGVAVCSPPKFHAEQSIAALDAGLPVLLEKPPTPDIAGCRKIAERLTQGGELLLGYTYRWWPPVQRLKSLIEAGSVGSLRYARFTMSAHLADWHPWEKYQDFFMASRELGGGALLDESHFVDLMIWFFGMPERLFARVEKISDLDIATDDLVDLSAAYGDGLRVAIHLDLFGRPHEKSITIIGEQGTLQCLFNPDAVRIGRKAESLWETESFAVDRNDMFVGVAREFLERISGARRPPTCAILDGLKVMQVVEACKESQRLASETVLGAVIQEGNLR
jgi:predicted dehydrogenase